MNEHLGKHLGELEIADLIEESVANAAKRRQQFVEDSLVDLTEDEARNIEGGFSISTIEPTTSGMIYKLPCCTTVGLIATEPTFSTKF